MMKKPLVQAIDQDPVQPTSGRARHRALQPPDEHDMDDQFDGQDGHRDKHADYDGLENDYDKWLHDDDKYKSSWWIKWSRVCQEYQATDPHPPWFSPSFQLICSKSRLSFTNEIDDYHDDVDFISERIFMNQSVATWSLSWHPIVPNKWVR